MRKLASDAPLYVCQVQCAMAVSKGLRRLCLILCHTTVRPLSCGKVGWKGTLSGIAGIMGLVSELISRLASKIAKSSSNFENLIDGRFSVSYSCCLL